MHTNFLARRIYHSPKMFWAASLIVICLGFGIRLHGLGQDSFWLDEMLTLNSAGRGPGNAIIGARDHPPAFYILASVAITEFGETEFAARLVSLFAGMLAIPLLIRFGRVTNWPGAGLWAALFLVISPYHLKYTQEARHYALLMTVSLSTYILLFIALQRPRWKYWIIYAVLTTLNLYVHYAAFLVLAAQSILIGLWLLWHLREGRPHYVRYAIATALIVFVLFLPWLPRLVDTLRFNLGAETVTGTGTLEPIWAWADTAFWNFGMYFRPLPQLMLLFSVIGLMILAFQRDFLILSLIITGLLLPFLMIQIVQVARPAFPRYIIFMLPYYLFAAALVPATILDGLGWRNGRRVFVTATLSLAALLIFSSWRAVRYEHSFVKDDWRSIVQFLNLQATNSDVLVLLSMNFANGFNSPSISLPYYLERSSENEYKLIHGNKVSGANLFDPEYDNAGVWAVLYDHRHPNDLLDVERLGLQAFQSHLYTFPAPGKEGTALDKVIGLYEMVIPMAQAPSPRCLLEKDLAVLFAQRDDFSSAEKWMSQAIDTCPGGFSAGRLKIDDEQDYVRLIYERAIETFQQQNQADEAHRVAENLYVLDQKNLVALEQLTVVDLLREFKEDRALVDYQNAAETVRPARFVMPQNGDWGDVLLIHPPASVKFDLTLPEEPTVLRTRIAMDPKSWKWGGDGSTFVITATLEDREPVILLEQHVSNSPEDRGWHLVEIPLVAYAGQTIGLTLRTGPGPQGDFTGDWSGWETPRILMKDVVGQSSD